MELKSCPFCGGEAKLDPATYDSVAVSVECKKCSCSIFLYGDKIKQKTFYTRAELRKQATALNKRAQCIWNKRSSI